MLSRALPYRARHLLPPYARSAHFIHALGLSSQAAVAPAAAGDHQRHRHEEERAVKVTVWWDFHFCRLPPGVSAVRFSSRVVAALRGAGIRGPVEINAFGNVRLLGYQEQEDLAATGITLSHLPYRAKDSSDLSFMADIIYWIAHNPPPAHFFLISGDEEFANILHRLRMSNYNVLLACPEVGSKRLRRAATLMWPWEALAKGVDLSPKLVNQPPDGSSSSWYGHYKGTADIQLLKSKHLGALPQNTKAPHDTKSIVNEIKKVLQLYPEGISLLNLRAELQKANVYMHKEFFRLKIFAGFLQEMPDIVKFIDPLPGDNQPAVLGVFKRSMEPSEQDFDGMDSNQSTIVEKHLCETEGEELSSLASQPLLSESSCAQNKTLEADVPSTPSDQLSSGENSPPDLTPRTEPDSSQVEPDVSLVADVPSTDALSRDQKNAQAVDSVKQTEPQVSHTEADGVAAAGTPTPGAQGKKGLLERILSLWNGRTH